MRISSAAVRCCRQQNESQRSQRQVRLSTDLSLHDLIFTGQVLYRNSFRRNLA
jgi:hypothetical protein